jgi:CubicO group peptidase (beta-lactamase class C family)
MHEGLNRLSQHRDGLQLAAIRSTMPPVTGKRAVLLCAAAMVFATVIGCDGQASDSSSRQTAAASTAAAPTSAADLTRVGPEIAERIRSYVDPAKNAIFRPIRAVIIEVDGVTVLEHYYRGSSSDTSNVFSVTKSFVGTLIGIALADGSLRSVDQTLDELLPAYAAEMEPEEAAITLRQLLTMTAGLPEELGRDLPGWMLTDDWVRSILAEPLDRLPGETFAYSNASSHLLSAILTEATGMSVLDYARARLFDPLGITSRPAPDLLFTVEENALVYEQADFAWPHDPQGVSTGFSFLKLTANDMAAFGRLYLDDGRWNGQQVVPMAWVDAATTEQVQVDNATEGYGYQWWVTTAGGHAAYAAEGYGGQLIEVVPDLRLVAVFSTELTETDAAVDEHAYISILSQIIDQVENE